MVVSGDLHGRDEVSYSGEINQVESSRRGGGTAATGWRLCTLMGEGDHGERNDVGVDRGCCGGGWASLDCVRYKVR